MVTSGRAQRQRQRNVLTLCSGALRGPGTRIAAGLRRPQRPWHTDHRLAPPEAPVSSWFLTVSCSLGCLLTAAKLTVFL